MDEKGKKMVLIVMLLLVLPLGSALASDYPNKPITIIVPMAPGGLGDLGARALAEAMEKHIKQPVVVVNKPGGGMTVGGYAVASARPDGYTLGLFVNPTAVPEIYSYFYSSPYSSSDLRPVCRVYNFFIAISVRGDAPWNTFKELIDYARINPGLKFAHNGKSSGQYIFMKTIAKQENIKLVDVPFDGDGAQIPALLGGHIPISTAAFAVVKPHMLAKKVKVLAVATERRTSLAPDIPCLAELGYKLPYYESFLSLFAPRQTPDAVIKKINEVVKKVVEEKEFQAKVKNLDLAIAYEDSVSLERYLAGFKSNVLAFFKEEGLVK
ncbi:MAG: tripartite tricarboxylate transporter substrate binding protein [Candidatus Methanomethyliaceae archaeon]